VDWLEILLLIVKCAVVFVLGAALFDVVHYILHVWENSRFRVLRFLGGLHGVHHLFLDKEMKLQRQHSRLNLLNHVIPEYLTAVVGMILLGFVFGWLPVLLVIALRTIMVIVYLFQKGEDFTHYEMSRINANRSLIFVGPRYHALHHVYVNQHYSSFINVFDLVCGTNCQIAGRRFLVTGSSGAYGSAMVAELRRRGALVDTATYGSDFTSQDVSKMRGKLEQADVVVLAHGAKGDGAWDANYVTPSKIIDLFREIGKNRLVPPEVWALGSEIEIHPHFGARDLVEYSRSKRAFARRARAYYSDPDLIYRHIVPSAFTSQMGRGLISAKTAVKISLFFIARGFSYVPVTYTTLAYWNYFKFLALPKQSGGPDV
jgi:hypothetical protein